MSSGPVRNGNGDERRRGDVALLRLLRCPSAWAYLGRLDDPTVFRSDDERRVLLLRMGAGPTASAYLGTLARATGISREALTPKLEALEHEGLVISERAPTGLRYRLTNAGRRVRAG